MTNAAYYLTFTFAVERRKAAAQAAGTANADVFLLINTLVLFVVLFAKPLGGWLSDKVGRRRLMMVLTVATMALIYPAINLMMSGTLQHFFWGQAILAIPLGMALGLQGAMVVEIFPLRTRHVDEHVHSVTLALAGGSPMVATADRR
jgi:MHS family proline/betaine transporter-like MFS transporter